MTETLMDRRAVFMRISSESDLIGKASVKPDEDTIIRYNWRQAESMMDEIINHAEQNDGKAIIPFDSIVSVRSLDTCSQFILWRTDGRYLIGKLYESGEDYKYGMDDRDGYTAPNGTAGENRVPLGEGQEHQKRRRLPVWKMVYRSIPSSRS